MPRARGPTSDHDRAPLTFQEATRRFQARYLRLVLEGVGWNVTQAALRLGLTRSHVYNLITSFELKRK
ncbi:Hypothetical protein A7982_11638 [Minicystis rosea]|nr:Hypothetical protein A7982_11638 [Minicystis rosea]